MAYNSTIDKATDDILIYGNTVKDGSGTSYVPLLDTDGHLQLDVLTSGLPTGASTSANQTTIIGHLDGVEGLLTTIDGRVDGIEALLTTIDADTSNIPAQGQALAAASMPVVLTAAQITTLTPPAAITGFGTAANQATIIGHVDGIETLIGTTNTTLTTIDGRVDGIEGLLTTISGNVDGLETSNSAIQTAVQLIDDTIFTAGTDTYTEATSKGQMLLAVRRDADTTLANTTNEFVPLQVDANGYLKVEVFSGATLPVSLTSTTVTGTVAVTQSGTWDEVGINDSGNSITVDYATTGSGTATGALRVELPTNGTGVVGLNAGTNAIGKLAANSGVDIGDVDVTSIAAGTNIIGKVGHDITGMGHGVTTVTTAGTDVALAGSTVCKRVMIQSQTDNTSLIAVGATGVDATIATGTGIILYPGDTIDFEIDNLADVFIDSLVNGEGVRYTYWI